MSRGSRLRRFLGAGRLAVWLLMGISAYAWLATEIPQGDPSDAAVATWIAQHSVAERAAGPLGLHHAFVQPAFIAAVVLLAVSTGVCAWRRTSPAWEAWRTWGTAPKTVVTRLRERPTLTVPVAHDRDPLANLGAGLGALGLASRREGDVLVASRNRLGLLGSPVFHWSLVVLIAALALGRLTRAEGIIAIPVGGSKTDERAAYAYVLEGPLYPGHTGLGVGVSDLELSYRSGGMDRGPSPLVTLTRAGVRVAQGHVYPNSPLRFGGLLIHMGGYGLAVPIALFGADGQERARATPLMDFDTGRPSGTSPVRFALTGAQPGAPSVTVTLTVQTDRQDGQIVERIPHTQRIVLTSSSPLMQRGSVALAPGQSVRFKDGTSLRLLGLGYFVRLSVADDWSVFPIYVMFLVSITGVGLSLLLVPRIAWAMIVKGADGSTALNLVVRRTASAAAFEARVGSAAERAAREGGSG